MVRTLIEVIPHEEQRYDTCGDWVWLDQDFLLIRVSKLGDWRFEQLVSLHELVEATLCRYKGIDEKDVTVFDVTHPELKEPGASLEAPYHFQHKTATYLEYKLAEELGVSWDEYDKAIENLPDWIAPVLRRS